MKFLSCLASTALALGLPLTAFAQDADGFTDLALDNFETEGNWQEQDGGVIHLEPREGETGWKRYGSYLQLEGEAYADFTFEFEYLLGEGGNSGLYFRIEDHADPVGSGFEVQLLDSNGKPDDEMGHHDHGGVIKTAGATSNAGKPAGEWDHISVTMKGNHLTVILNGTTVQDIDLDEARPEDKALHAEGGISIQDHGLPFTVRNLRVKRL